MFDVLTQNLRRTAFVLIPIIMIAIVYLIVGVEVTLDENDGIGALLDDTWIHVRFADHVASGEGLSYNPGEVTFGATSPLWIFILAIPYTLFEPDIMSQVEIAIFLSAVGYIFTIISITGFGWWVTRRASIGVFAGLITVATGRYLWMGLSGMEITTFTTLCILAIWSHMADIRSGIVFGWRTGILVALATLARPEAYLLAALLGFDTFIFVALRDGQSVLQRLIQGWRGIIGYILLAGSYPFATLLGSGYPLPNTFRAKSQLGREFPDLPHAYFQEPAISHGPLLIVLMLAGTGFLLWQAHRRSGDGIALAVWEPLFILAVFFMVAQNFVSVHFRYVAPAIPFHALYAAIAIVYGAEYLQKWLRIPRLHHWLTIGLGTALIMVTFVRSYEDGIPRVSNDVGQLKKMHVQAGHWVRNHTTPDQLIALNDVGAIVHISDRPVLDMEGLVSSEVIEATLETPDLTCEHDLQLARLMLEDMPRFILVFDRFYPCLTSWQVAPESPALQHVRKPFVITGPTVIAAGQLMVYEPVFENFPVQAFINPEAWSAEVSFEDNIQLVAYETLFTEQGLEVVLWWQAEGQPQHDYHVFVHVIDEEGTIIQAQRDDGVLSLQHDSQPQNNQFRTTLWRTGDIVRDSHMIALPRRYQLSTSARLRIGLYKLRGNQFYNLRREDGQGEAVILPIKQQQLFGG